MVDKMALIKQQKSDWYDNDTDPFDDLVDRADHLGLLAASHRLCFLRELRDVGFISNVCEFGMASSGYDKAS